MKIGFPFILHQHLTPFLLFIQFVNVNETLGMSQLEETLPFTILRTNLIELNERQMQHGRMSVIVGDEDKEDE